MAVSTVPLQVQDETEADFPPARVGWTAVGVLLLLYALAFIDRQVISLLVADLRHDLGVSDFQISLLQGFAFAVFYSVLGLPFGMAVDRWPRRNVICIGVLIWAVAATACGLAQTYPQLLIARMFVGAGEAALAPAAYSMLSELFPRKRLTFALSVYAIGALLGAEASLAIGALLVHYAERGITVPLLGELPAWRFAFIATGLPGLVLAFFIFVIPEPVRRRAGEVAATWADVARFMLARWRFFACHFIGFGAVMALAYARMSWNPTYLARRFHWPIDQIGITLAAFGFVTGVIAFLFSGAFVDRMVARGIKDAHFRFYVAGSGVLLIAGGLSFLSPTPLFFFLPMGVCAIWLGMAAIAPSAIQLVTPPELRGRVSAVYLLAVGMIGMTVGPAIVGLLTDLAFKDPARIHLSLATTFVSLSLIAGVAFALGLKPMRRAADLSA
jgi:MFS family permease